MNNAIFVLNSLVVICIVVSAALAIHFEKLLPAILTLGASGSFVSLAFILLHAPDVAIAEAAVGAVLSTVIFIIALRKVEPKEDEEEDEVK